MDQAFEAYFSYFHRHKGKERTCLKLDKRKLEEIRMLGNSGLFGAVIGIESGDKGRCFESSNFEWYNH